MADSFNVNVKDVDTGAGFLNSSRGATPIEPVAAVKASNPIADAVSGLGDLFKQTVSAADQTIKLNITDELRRQTNQIFNEVGVGEVGVANSGPDTPPKALIGAFDNLQRVKDAMDSGAISKTNFDGRLVSVAQQLRYQYQGHQEFIDQKMHEITGVRPQHQVFMDLMDESNKRVSAQQKQDTQRLAALQHYGPDLDPNKMKTPEDIRRNYPTVESMAVEAMPKLIARNDIKAKDAVLEHTLKVKSADQTLTKDNLTESTWGRFNMVQAATMQSLGGLDGVNKFIDQYTANPKPELLNTFLSSYTAMHSKSLNEMSDYVRNKVAEAKLPASAFSEIMAPVESYMKMQRDAIEKGDLSVVKLMATRNEAMKQGGQAAVYGNKDLAALSALQSVAGPEVVKFILAGSPKFQSSIMGDKLYTDVVNFMSNKRNAIIDTTDPVNKLTPEARLTALNTYQELIKSPTNSPDFKAKAVNVLYAPKNVGLMAAVSESDRKALWTKMTDPALVSEMKKGSGMNYQVYSEWVQNEFRDQFTREMTTLLNSQQGRGAGAIVYNEATNRFVVTPMEGYAATKDTPVGTVLDRNAMRRSTMDTVDGINAGLKALEPILKDKGLSVQDYLKGSYGAYALPGMAPKPTTGAPMSGISKLGATVDGGTPVVSSGASQALAAKAEADNLQNATNAQLSPAQGIDMEIQELVKLYMDKPDPDVLKNINQLVEQLSTASDKAPPVVRTNPPMSTTDNTTSASKSSLKNRQ